MFHVKHSHKRKFLRIGRILPRCGRFACAASSAVRGAASAGGRAAHLSGTPPQLAGAPLTWWRRCLTWRGRYLTWRGCYLTWRGCRLGWRGRCLGCRETAGVSRPRSAKWFPLRRKRRPLQLRVQLQRGFPQPATIPSLLVSQAPHLRRWSSPRGFRSSTLPQRWIRAGKDGKRRVIRVGKRGKKRGIRVRSV